ncbi:MAG TPA: flagellar hook-basal body complex protein FliE [Verrucomicrobiae bacterium]|jgi:flagellar hook-basal body complex protein FliE
MDALSALKTMVGLQTGGVQNTAANVTQTQNIPATELQQLNTDVPVQSTQSSSSSTGAGFEGMLGDLVNEVSQKQSAANDAVNGLMSGKNVSLHQTMISMEEANVSFQMMVEVRNKLLDSYQELMRMQV